MWGASDRGTSCSGQAEEEGRRETRNGAITERDQVRGTRPAAAAGRCPSSSSISIRHGTKGSQKCRPLPRTRPTPSARRRNENDHVGHRALAGAPARAREAGARPWRSGVLLTSHHIRSTVSQIVENDKEVARGPGCSSRSRSVSPVRSEKDTTRVLAGLARASGTRPGSGSSGHSSPSKRASAVISSTRPASRSRPSPSTFVSSRRPASSPVRSSVRGSAILSIPRRFSRCASSSATAESLERFRSPGERECPRSSVI